ncbi:hypothetical protein HDU98_011503 [Podochytrium sp. JEL0797]|nr:hypothetical protein HDU98_011503 [Podochytrium sp. JEL0797]
MTSLFEAAALAAVLSFGFAYYLVVPSNQGELGGLMSPSVSPEGKSLVKKYYIFPDGQFAECSLGRTYYRILGPSTGKRIVIIHGITGTYTATWATSPQVLDSLAKKGYQVLAYDIYGRGCSDSPGVKYDQKTYSTQLLDLMNHVGWTRANVLGYSMGGTVAVHFANSFPERCDRVVLVAPSGLQKSLPLSAKFLLLPGIGTFVAHAFGRDILTSNRIKHVALYSHLPHMALSEQAIVIYRHNAGFIRAFLSTLRYGSLCGSEAVFEQVGEKFKERVMCIWGAEDDTCGFDECMPVFRRCMPEASVVALKDGSHTILIEDCERVLGPVHVFLQK